ncbi:unnamed protein product [Closterium sp. NIES-54]
MSLAILVWRSLPPSLPVPGGGAGQGAASYGALGDVREAESITCALPRPLCHSPFLVFDFLAPYTLSHPQVAELGKALHLKEHKVTDGEGKEATLCSPVETKGILGSDDRCTVESGGEGLARRKYLLDLIRLTPRDANFTATTTTPTTAATGTDTNTTANAANAANAANRLAILRPELVEKFCQEEQVERWMAQKGVSERPSAEEVEALREKGELPDVLFNPNALTEFKLADDSKGELPAVLFNPREEQVERWMAQKGVSERPSAEEVEAAREKGELPDMLFNPNALTEFKLADDSKVCGVRERTRRVRLIVKLCLGSLRFPSLTLSLTLHTQQQEVEEDEALVRKAGKYLIETAVPALVEEDEALVRKAGKYLIETALPALVADIKSSDGWPVDGRSLASTMHAHGVNLRYLGRVAKEVADVEQVYWLCVAEMVVRATKHVLKAVLRETLEQDVAGAIAHFLNCFLGTSTTTPPPTLPGVGDTDKTEGGAAGGGGKKKKKGKGGERKDGEERKEEGEEKKEAFLFVVDVPGYTRITADMVWSDITEGVKYKYQFEIPPETRNMLRSLATLRNICLKMGIVLAARDYNLECDVTIAIADVCDLLPQVKFASSYSFPVLPLLPVLPFPHSPHRWA